MNSYLRYKTAVTSLLVMVALMGHSVYHALDLHHHHHSRHSHHHGHHHSHSHDHHSDSDSKAPDARDGIKCELFSLVPVAPQKELILERWADSASFPSTELAMGITPYLVANSRAPPSVAS